MENPLFQQQLKKIFHNNSQKTKSHLEMNQFLYYISSLNIESVYDTLKTNSQGLSFEEAEDRIALYGKNEVVQEETPAWYWMLLNNLKNPFILVLILLGVVSYFTEDIRAAVVVLVMILISVFMRFFQEYRSEQSAKALRAMVQIKASVRRHQEEKGEEEPEDGNIYSNTSGKRKEKQEVSIEELVPGDIIYLSAGDMIPADIRLIRSKDLFISQSTLTGESFPVEKYDVLEKNEENRANTNIDPIQLNNICFMGTSVVSGFAKAVVVATGEKTFFGSIAKNILGYRPETSFDKGVNKVTWLLIRFIAIMVPIIFFINGFFKHDWREAFLFSIAVAVGLTPEMLPMILTANLAKGAVAMSKFKVIVKRLHSIQVLGAMDILCSDKTGTLTQDRIILEKYLDINGDDSIEVLEYGFLNSYFQTGLKSMLDKAILEHMQIKTELNIEKDYQKIDEIPFDFLRKRLTVVVRKESSENLLICKGALEQTLDICSFYEYKGEIVPKNPEKIQEIVELANGGR